jgi:hypothetical protein
MLHQPDEIIRDVVGCMNGMPVIRDVGSEWCRTV